MASQLARVCRHSTSVTITDPLVKYQSLVTTGVYCPDQSQHRLAKHLQKVYARLKDYTPSIEYQQRLKRITEITSKPEDEGPLLAVKNHPIWRNPLFKSLFTTPEGNDKMALIRILTSHEAALEIDSPKGLFLSGEVGTGKSMLISLLSEGLPTSRKKRWHFNTFMLYAFSQLENFRRSRPGMSGPDQEYSLIWLAKKLVEESPILFLDEFQLPDRATSKILSHLFIAFFQLGGVLIASSNRVPEELQNAIGIEYTAPARGGIIRNLFGGARVQGRGELFGSSSDFAAFLEVLKARCDFWHMEGATDWRRRDATLADGAEIAPRLDEEDKYPWPSRYFPSTDDETAWHQIWAPTESTPWQPASLVVYGRSITIPMQRDGHVYWDFEKLVESLGPADYVTMASNYHTFIIDNIPVLTTVKKNEARRFITLLDALYEAKCKLIVRAAAGPDDLFFPETRKSTPSIDGEVVNSDAIHSETVAEVYQDSSSPFRPNVSFYDTGSATSKYDPDQDSDFVLEESRIKEQEARKKLDFGNTSAFTGEDERFAYKRASSRLWEMCSEQWHARTGDWWQPLPVEARHWEAGTPSTPLRLQVENTIKTETDARMGPVVELEEPAGLSKWRVASLRKTDGSSKM